MATNSSITSLSFLGKLLSVLRVQPKIGGLEISDSILRFVYFNGERSHMTTVRVPPGVLEAGVIKQRPQFLETLKVVRKNIGKAAPRRGKMSVVVTLSSVNVYTHVFTLPLIEGEGLERAIELNMQMVSPADASETYSGWQLIEENTKQGKLDVLGAFVNKVLVNEMTNALEEGGFLVYAVESRALALTRLVRTLAAGFDRERSYVFLNLDGNGLEFLVVRRAQLYFQYFTPWRDLYGDERSIPQSVFEAAIIRNLHQVLNFYTSHWSESLGELFLVTRGLKEEVVKIITGNFSFTVKELVLTTKEPISPSWFVALGSALRGLVPRKDDRDITLSGISAQDDFRQYQVILFANFWRILIPVSLGLLVGVFFAVQFFFRTTLENLTSKPALALQREQLEALNDLRAQVQTFNRSVLYVEAIQRGSRAQVVVLDKINELAKKNSITLLRFGLQSYTSPININGTAPSETQILAFKKSLDENPEFENVDLPLAGIRGAGQGLSFSMSFSIASLKTP